jgi:hypothetical protein
MPRPLSSAAQDRANSQAIDIDRERNTIVLENGLFPGDQPALVVPRENVALLVARETTTGVRPIQVVM